MRHILICLTTFVLGLAMTAAVEGHGSHGGGSHGGGSHGGGSHAGTKNSGTKNSGTKNSGAKNSGTKNSGTKNSGTKSSGTKNSSHGHHSRNYRGWSDYCQFGDSGAYGYYSSDDDAWYYWYGPEDIYRPVSDMADYPPDDSTPPILPPGARRVP